MGFPQIGVNLKAASGVNVSSTDSGKQHYQRSSCVNYCWQGHEAKWFFHSSRIFFLWRYAKPRAWPLPAADQRRLFIFRNRTATTFKHIAESLSPKISEVVRARNTKVWKDTIDYQTQITGRQCGLVVRPRRSGSSFWFLESQPGWPSAGHALNCGRWNSL